MNCDLVFEILTRGPFPSGEPTDASVELHLSRCHDCRRLAEALRPAVELFHETLAYEEDGGSLPGYYGLLSEADEPQPTAVLAMAPWREAPAPRQALPAPLPRRWRNSLPQAGQLLGAMSLGAAVCVAFAIVVAQSPSPRQHPSESLRAGAPMAALNVAALPGRDVQTRLAALHLPEACLETSSLTADRGSGAPLHAANHLLCCTHCHNAAQAERPPVPAIALLQREACVACHLWE